MQTLLDASAKFGSVYTEDRERIEKPVPAAIVMWNESGSQVPGAGEMVTRTINLILRLLVPRLATSGDVKMQTDNDTKLQDLLEVIRDNPQLDTGSGPLVLSCFAQSWDINYDPEHKRMVTDVRVAVEYEVS